MEIDILLVWRRKTMSRSCKHSFHCYFDGGSNKLSRSFANRALRRAVKASISSRKEIDYIDTLPVLREVSSVCSFSASFGGLVYPSLPKWVLYPNSLRYSKIPLARRIHKFMGK
jgi:hypothetical protein